MATLDAVAYKETTRRQWHNAAEAWHRCDPVLHMFLGPGTEVMLDLARIGVGSHGLDVAAGAGEPAIAVGLPVSEQDETWNEVSAALRQFERPDGFEAACELLVGAGTR